MKKLAVFVEGATELIFTEKLIRAIAVKNDVVIQTKKIRGGTSVPRQVIELSAGNPCGTERYFVLIFDCGGDHQVKTRILEEHEGLTQSGYSKIIGFRDVRPSFSLAEVPRLEVGLRYQIKTSKAPVSFILSVMEIEAWFIAEHSHFQKINPELDVTKIEENFGFNPSNHDVCTLSNPADDIDKYYQLVGEKYQKSSSLTLDALDMTEIYCNTSIRVNYLALFIQELDDFMTL